MLPISEFNESLAFPRILYAGATPHQLYPVLQALFVIELMAPGDEFWLVAQRVWNVPVIDNRANAFRHLEPTWAQARIRLLQVLQKLMQSGMEVYVLTQKNRDNAVFLNELGSMSVSERVHVQELRSWEVQTEGLAMDTLTLEGPLTFSQTGILVPRGQVVVQSQEDQIKRVRLALRRTWNHQ